jgi:hypothetical protein
MKRLLDITPFMEKLARGECSDQEIMLALAFCHYLGTLEQEQKKHENTENKRTAGNKSNQRKRLEA